MGTVDLNADLGEGFGVWKLGDDDAMLDLVTSANVACGFHAGDPALLLRTCRAAAERGVRIGAQVSYRDLAGFGRRFIDAMPEDLTADVIYQIGALQALAHAAGATVSYVKPHGALYNTIVNNHDQARAVAKAAKVTDIKLVFIAGEQPLFLACSPRTDASTSGSTTPKSNSSIVASMSALTPPWVRLKMLSKSPPFVSWSRVMRSLLYCVA